MLTQKKVTEITSNSVLIFCVLVIHCIKNVNKYHLSHFIHFCDTEIGRLYAFK